MASISKRYNAGEDGPITEWTVFNEETGVRVASYVLEVHSKVASRDYESAGDIFDDYETCVKLLIKLMKESSRLAVSSYDKEYYYNYAVQIKAKMLRSFSTIFLAKPPHPLEQWEEWVFNRLDQQSVDWLKEEKAAPEVLLSESENFIKRLDTIVKMMDENLQSDIKKLKEGPLEHLLNFLQGFQQTQNELQAYLDAKTEEFKLGPNVMMIDENVHREIRMQTEDHLQRLNILYEDVKYTISHVQVDMRSLTKLSRSCNSSLGILEETILMLETEFFRLRCRSEKHLSKKWLEVKDFMDQHPLVRSEKEIHEKARVDRDMCWEKIKHSSGLLH